MADILIVDDIESNQVIKSLLEETPYHYFSIRSAETANKAMQMVKQKEPSVLFLDVSLPDGDGIEFGQKVLEMYPNVPVVVLTHLQMFDTVQRCINAGFSGYLLKPVVKSELLSTFSRIVSQNSARESVHELQRKSGANDSFETDLANPIETAKKFIQLNFYESITLKEVSNLVYLSPSHFSRMFKEETGYNYVEYLMRYRVDRSKNQLKMTMLPIEVIACNHGFSSAAYFSTTFKKLEGVTPSEYRSLFSRLNVQSK
ncbi:helix-turn-helix transcriptional regulator [Alkalihalobacterium elongatum]|uniref:helix-turn-helix transcriptional regulator n=1 Tax=Alkalihalobacterium elongatum TaxID=2675466 RepID=UPI001C1F7233|nr:helix-turn-helix domain-containing protein [Alkalihalobacterium elongatum]